MPWKKKPLCLKKELFWIPAESALRLHTGRIWPQIVLGSGGPNLQVNSRNKALKMLCQHPIPVQTEGIEIHFADWKYSIAPGGKRQSFEEARFQVI